MAPELDFSERALARWLPACAIALAMLTAACGKHRGIERDPSQAVPVLPEAGPRAAHGGKGDGRTQTGRADAADAASDAETPDASSDAASVEAGSNRADAETSDASSTDTAA